MLSIESPLVPLAQGGFLPWGGCRDARVIAQCENVDAPPRRTQRVVVLLVYDSDCDEVKTFTLPVLSKT